MKTTDFASDFVTTDIFSTPESLHLPLPPDSWTVVITGWMVILVGFSVRRAWYAIKVRIDFGTKEGPEPPHSATTESTPEDVEDNLI